MIFCFEWKVFSFSSSPLFLLSSFVVVPSCLARIMTVAAWTFCLRAWPVTLEMMLRALPRSRYWSWGSVFPLGSTCCSAGVLLERRCIQVFYHLGRKSLECSWLYSISNFVVFLANHFLLSLTFLCRLDWFHLRNGLSCLIYLRKLASGK